MPSQWTSELPSMRTTSPHTHQISLELEVPICQTSPPPTAQTHCLQAPLPRTSGPSPTHATSPRTQDSDLHCHASNSGSTGESQTRRGSLGHDPASSPRQYLPACSNPASPESSLGLPFAST